MGQRQTLVPEKPIRQSQSVCAGEQEYIQKRKQKVLEALKKKDIECSAELVPRIALLCSGGGQRAGASLIGSLRQLVNEGLLDCMLFIGGVSGSTWAMSTLYRDEKWSEHFDEAVSMIKHIQPTDEELVQWYLNRAESDNFSLTDIWAVVTSAGVMEKVECGCLSEEANRKPTNPYPIYCTVEKYPVSDGPPEERWFEFSPHEAGFTALGLFIETSLLGSKFKAGELLEKKPEMDMFKVQGLCSSAIADMGVNMKEFGHWIQSKFCKFGTNMHQRVRGVFSCFPCCHEDISSPKEQPKDTDKKDFGESPQEEDSPNDEENQNFYLHLAKQMYGTLKKAAEMQQKGVPRTIRHFLQRITPLCFKWEWGTVRNFLYKYPRVCIDIPESCSPADADIRSPVFNRKNLHLVDAGLVLNVPYPPFLGDKRDIDLIIALDYSDYKPTDERGAFETVMEARDYAAQLNKPFPVIDESILEEKKFPKGCYVFEGKDKEPTIIHMPLFNRQNCKDEKELEEKKTEFHTSSPTTSEGKIKDLHQISAKNIEMNRDTLWEEIRKAAHRRAER